MPPVWGGVRNAAQTYRAHPDQTRFQKDLRNEDVVARSLLVPSRVRSHSGPRRLPVRILTACRCKTRLCRPHLRVDEQAPGRRTVQPASEFFDHVDAADGRRSTSICPARVPRALPSPGTERQLLAAAAKAVDPPLPTSAPLWRFHWFDGLEGGRFAFLITRAPFAMGRHVDVPADGRDPAGLAAGADRSRAVGRVVDLAASRRAEGRWAQRAAQGDASDIGVRSRGRGRQQGIRESRRRA